MVFAVAVLTLAACSKTFDHSKAATEGNAIGFGTWAETLTKAEARVQGSNDFDEGDTFNVYGYKTIGSSSSSVFNGVVVTLGASGWDYSPHRYWDKNASEYGFYAVSPSGLVNSANDVNGQITTKNIDFSGNDSDVLVANKEIVTTIPSPSAVELDFNHVASLVDIKVKKSPALKDANATVTISSITLDNIEDNGILTVNSSDYAPALTVAVSNWGSDDGTLKTYTPESGVTKVYGDNSSSAISTENKKTIVEDTSFDTNNPAATPAASTDLFTSLIVKPQTFVAPAVADRATQEAAANNTTAQKITITYQIAVTNGGTNEYTSTLWLADFDKVDDNYNYSDSDGDGNDNTALVGSWEPGKHYIFYITIDANAIMFTARINDWATAINGYNYLLN